VVEELEETPYIGIKGSRNGDQLNKRQVRMLKGKLNRQNLEDIMTEEIYQSRLTIKALLTELHSQ
jgi:hypothetical protein